MSVLDVPEGAIASFGYDLNRRGVIVGWYSLGIPIAALWGQDGTRLDLPSLSEGVSTQAYSINERGIAVGQSGGFPVIWDGQGRIAELPLPEGAGSGVAWSISDQGTIFGRTRLIDSGEYVTVVWCRGGRC